MCQFLAFFLTVWGEDPVKGTFRVIVMMRMMAIKMHVQGNYELHNPKRRNKESESPEKLELDCNAIKTIQCTTYKYLSTVNKCFVGGLTT